jgi:predicted nucleic acid-binding protein
MILLDAFGLVAFLKKEPAARDVREILTSGQAAITAANLAEAIDVLVRVLGRDPREVDDAIVPLVITSLPVMPIGEMEARLAASLRITHYHRERAPLSLADCMLLACASLHGAEIATSDPAIVAAALLEGIAARRLKDSSGRRP